MKFNLENTCFYQNGFVNLKKQNNKNMKTFETLEHADVYGNTKHYIVLGNDDKTIIVKISEKDYQKIKELENYEKDPNQYELPL